jgi:hypothetical protein
MERCSPSFLPCTASDRRMPASPTLSATLRLCQLWLGPPPPTSCCGESDDAIPLPIWSGRGWRRYAKVQTKPDGKGRRDDLAMRERRWGRGWDLVDAGPFTDNGGRVLAVRLRLGRVDSWRPRLLGWPRLLMTTWTAAVGGGEARIDSAGVRACKREKRGKSVESSVGFQNRLDEERCQSSCQNIGLPAVGLAGYEGRA